MSSVLTQLSDRSLQRLREALASNRLTMPVSSLTLAQLIPQEQLQPVLEELRELQKTGINPPVLIRLIDILLVQREKLRSETGRLELVMTGPEPPGSMIRDTAVVVRQIFLNAKRSICICGFAVYQGKDIFAALANRMEFLPELKVRMYLNIDRPHGDTSPSELLLAKFQKRFRENQWPENMRLPEVFYDPRPLADDDASKSACLHAKFVIADSQHVFLSSANFTEAAQQRNIEAGVLLDRSALARDLESHFQSLVDHGFLKKLRFFS
jgi:phosphatidylserine/phosphatidylglycerophosphate/cardiolipin synthase-like enzyme